MADRNVVEILENSPAYQAGWKDGRFEPYASFATNSSIGAWQDMERLAYYRGYREGLRIRQILGSSAQSA